MTKNKFNLKYSTKISKKIKEIRKKYKDRDLIDPYTILEELDMAYISDHGGLYLGSRPLDKIISFYEGTVGPVLCFSEEYYEFYVFSTKKNPEKLILEAIKQAEEEIKIMKEPCKTCGK